MLGASAPQVLLLLIRQFALLVLIANLIAWPVAYWISRNWLQDFAYRTTLTGWIFVLSAGLALFVALLTVRFQSIRTALANPVDSLRHE